MGQSRWLALAVLCAATLMIILDGTIVTVALPAIQRDLGFSASGLAWVVNAYLIAFGGLLLLAGRLGDLIGGKRVFLAGLVRVHARPRWLCGLVGQPADADRGPVRPGRRRRDGLRGQPGHDRPAVPEPPERAKAMGVYSFTGAGGASLGLVLGGALTQALSWHWIFFVNVPFGVVAVVAGWLLLAGEPGIGPAGATKRRGRGRRPAGRPAGLMTASTRSSRRPGTAGARARTLGTAAVAAVLLAGFVVRQRPARTPLLPPRDVPVPECLGRERRCRPSR